MLYSLHVYNRRGQCLFERQWHGYQRPEDGGEHRRLIFGMLTAVVELVGKMKPREDDNVLVMKTDVYALHTYASLSGYRFVLITDLDAGDQKQTLFHLYRELWVECVVKNPLQDPRSGERISCPLFVDQLEKFVAQPYFTEAGKKPG
mmetsp:Transcript_16643/g.49702  ORF Transcript_16643/g.49702 Transcript_16643/m.49702 type:complete len:147 (+) Transcript_16643:254-694(+)|eukprot:CAMPEP_0119285808 /NCGR_PEP_ID=MMETSP1329-20130426/32890_1 /TAXON_ID=114041 /ORGANISM="Genus nov. species nov., Strain RCC1024" /LENGTH=146 /DNA_ID=CAMNT_0007286529 /DNA_START=164 /DNA_END=604 /DNA_ORIENTATION=-